MNSQILSQINKQHTEAIIDVFDTPNMENNLQ